MGKLEGKVAVVTGGSSGMALARIKGTKRAFEEHWVFDITVRDGRLIKVRGYVDTQALARASETA